MGATHDTTPKGGAITNKIDIYDIGPVEIYLFGLLLKLVIRDF